MSMYGLIKETSKARRVCTTIDLARVNNWLASKGLPTISSYGPSVRALENSVALGIENVDTSDMPKLECGECQYRSMLTEIKDSEREKFNCVNRAN